MEATITSIKQWVSDPVVAAVLGFIVTGTVLRLVSRLISSSRRK
ncbi:MAG: hypothetical protein ACE5GY_05700 [Thermodesulfobacteriota bacterium]